MEHEVQIMLQIAKNQPLGKQSLNHNFKGLPKLIDYGELGSFKFIIMELLGSSLNSLVDNSLNKRFSLSTIALIGVQVVIHLPL